MAAATMTRCFTRNLLRLRSEAKWSQGELSRRAGISVSYISMLERGRRSPPLPTIERVAKALKVSPLAMLS